MASVQNDQKAARLVSNWWIGSPPMHSSSETIGVIAAALAKARRKTRQSRKNPDCYHQVAVSSRRSPNVSLRILGQRSRYHPQKP